MDKRQKQIIFVGLLLVFLAWYFSNYGGTPEAQAQKKQTVLTKNYLETYSQAAIDEMHRAGVPASITLAQGILESGYGQSDLARNAFNHFGIKCAKGWQGEKFTAPSNEWSKRQQKMVKKVSCFRKYTSADESYRDHSDFLRGRERYAALFELAADDYEGWARGLQTAGYATDPEYANKLISLIERYNLQQYDK